MKKLTAILLGAALLFPSLAHAGAQPQAPTLSPMAQRAIEDKAQRRELAAKHAFARSHGSLRALALFCVNQGFLEAVALDEYAAATKAVFMGQKEFVEGFRMARRHPPFTQIYVPYPPNATNPTYQWVQAYFSANDWQVRVACNDLRVVLSNFVRDSKLLANPNEPE